MLPRNRRISKQGFPKNHKGSFRVPCTFFEVVFTRRKDNVADTACSVVVSSRVSKNATERNKVRRRAYNALALALPHIQRGLLILVYLGREAHRATERQMEHEILKAAQKARVLVRT